jgi:dihydrolipoamide dehydrogenase
VVVGETGEHVDVLIAGGGPAGYSAAIRAAQLGRSVTLVEREHVGGVCLNEGCIPSKAILSVSQLYRRMGEATVFGIDATPAFRIERFREWRDGVVQRLSKGVSTLLQRYGVKVIEGTAYFASDHRASVVIGERNEFIEFDNAVVATGSRACGGQLKLDGHTVVSPEHALALRDWPERIAIAGGGYVAAELATAFARLGRSVTLVADGRSILPGLEPAIDQVVARGLRGLGVEVHFGAGIEGHQDGALAIVSDDGKRMQIAADVVVTAGRRVPNTDGLGLDQVGVRLDLEGAIEVNTTCRSSTHSIYAAGDCAGGGPMMADRAIAQGRVAAECICGQHPAFDPIALPLVYFTEPEVMTAGLGEADALQAGYDTGCARFPFGASGRAATLSEQQGFVQIVYETSNERVLGIHAVGPHVSELAGEASLALELGATLQDLALTVHPHPTLSEALPEAAWLALHAPLHVFRTR